ncbi:cryptochrome/photolyase family protein [Scytonema sp. UIC 10036]|uniref:cryptochrome/photolyase family protein n=1 Tax=Scytonema sp. UIC 10036 TaxID=2304196 RepID=UPI0012DAB9DB|nr:cryptochrome/photolyase family protein [Scytonema sp. UIC 10036]MUG94398.1 cryptochrome/photolyase family protein [Scytonema sp. UIC 10036]
MMIGVWVLGDQLWSEQAALQNCPKADNLHVIMVESLSHVRERPYHKQKLVLVWSAMRHFAEELQQLGYSVTYKIAEDFETPLQHWIKEKQITDLRVMIPNDLPFLKAIKNLETRYLSSLNCQLTLIPNNHFLWNSEEFKTWAKPRKRLLMEDFYREGRRRFQILMEGDKPTGGQWNFDKNNRQPPKGKLKTPPAKWFEPDEITQKVITHVNSLPFPTYGTEILQPQPVPDTPAQENQLSASISVHQRLNTQEPFRWAVTRSQALEVLDWFINNRLPDFGPYQDAMVTGEETMWHAMLSPYLNIGLLQPLEVIQAAEKAYHQNKLPLNSVEGFIRQVLGWREYMHGIYHFVSADYPEKNWFNHTQPLPDFFWTGDTNLNCLRQILSQLQRTGYAHHIQRLMVLSNFALIAGISPQEVENWFHATFIDAYDWVMQTNVIGMGLFADGGVLASKPYAASGNYVNKMSDYCKGCDRNPKERVGEKACPFNFFYWDFLDRHRDKLQSQGRMSLILGHLDRISQEELESIRKQARDWHATLS